MQGTDKSESVSYPSCPTLCHPIDFTVHRILQATILEWVVISFSRASCQLRDPTLQVDFFYNLSDQRSHWAQITPINKITLLCYNLLCKYMYQQIPANSHEMFGHRYTYLSKYVYTYINIWKEIHI